MLICYLYILIIGCHLLFAHSVSVSYPSKMPEMPKRKYLIAGGVVTVLVIITIVLLAVLLPQSNDDGNSSPITSSVAPPTEETTTEEATTEPATTEEATTEEATTEEATTEPTTTETEKETPMLDMLDAMQQLMTGEGTFDRDFYEKLRECMGSFDSQLPAAQDGAWQGMIDYWNSNGTEEDHWGSSRSPYMEQNATSTQFLDMIIFEPCNYASNIAYYHDVTEMCNKQSSDNPLTFSQEYITAFGKIFSTLAMGSSFMHGSHTELGHQQDARPISVLAFLIHQGYTSALPNASVVVTDLSNVSRPLNAIGLSEEFFNMHLTMPVTEWYDYTNTLDIPNYYLVFTGIFSTALSMVFEPDVVDEVVPNLASIFGVPEDHINFIMKQYLPELREAGEGFDLAILKKTVLVEDTVGSVIKLVYALLWQEEVFAQDGEDYIFLNETINEKGWMFLPILNSMVDGFNSYDYFEEDFQSGIRSYPGDDWCNPVMPHAKWHLESGIGLLDLVYVGHEIYQLLSDPSNYKPESRNKNIQNHY